MRSLLALSLGFAALCLLSCSSQSTHQPLAPVAEPSGESAAQPGAPVSFVGGEYQLEVILEEMRVELTPVPDRTGQLPQALRYDLDIANFLRPESLEIESVSFDGNGDLEVAFIHRHPFPAPDLSQAISGTNRADLGYTGRLVIVAELDALAVPQNTFFGSIVANPALVVAPDGYVNPGILLLEDAANANTFPYVLLADEAEDNRIGIPNGGPTGSYDAPNGGWQSANLGPAGTGWTGYDYVHGGQAVRNTFTLSQAALLAGNVDLNLAVLIQYTDPRGRTGRSRRFPVTPADPLEFAYRLPYAALDGSRIAVDPVEVSAGIGSNAPIAAQMRDWDAQAGESPGSDLSSEPDVALIQTGASGAPTLELDVPVLASSPIPLTATGTGSGLPGDELAYDGTVINALGTAVQGDYFGLLRATDPEAADSARPDYHFGVDPVTLTPDSATGIAAVTYQAVPIEVEGAVPEITLVTPTGVVGEECATVTFSATATNSPTGWSWDFGGGASPNTSTDPSPMVTLLAPGVYSGTVTASNGFGSSAPFGFSFEVTPLALTTPTWGIQNLGPVTSFGGGGDQDATGLVIHDGKPAVAYDSGNGGANCCEPMIAQATVANPTNAGQWTVTKIQSGPPMPFAEYISMVSSNNRLATIRYGGPAAARLSFAQVLTPTGPGDWVHLDLDSGGVGFEDFELYEVNGLLATSYAQYFFDMQLKYARATTTNPTGLGNWVKMVVDTTGDSGFDSAMAEWNGGLVISHRNVANGDIRFAQSASTTPNSTADWTTSIVEVDGSGIDRWLAGTQTTLIPHQGRLWIAYADKDAGQMMVGHTTAATPTGPGDWTRFAIAGAGVISPAGRTGFSELGLIDGRLIVVYSFDPAGTSPMGIRAARADVCGVPGANDWVFSDLVIPSGTNEAGNGIRVLEHNGQILVSYLQFFNVGYAASTNGLW